MGKHNKQFKVKQPIIEAPPATSKVATFLGPPNRGQLKMSRLTPSRREAIIRRRGCVSDGDGQVHRISNLQVHHRDRNPENNDTKNLRVLTREEHEELHKRYGY